MNERTGKILDFLLTMDRAKTVLRKGYLWDGNRRESIAEHMWHLALWAMLLKDEIGFETDLLRTLKLVLTHDLVEIYAGDTYAYDEAGVAAQRAKEEKAAERLFSSLPDDLAEEFRGLWDEFEAEKTPESRFARSLDHMQGFVQNCISGGKSWKENGIVRERTFLRTDPPRRTDPLFAEILNHLYKVADEEDLWGEGEKRNDPEQRS
ncbi:MAG TPA: HD domain-containing protein [Synergistales bacterium]|nr:HD domain-containing protein [Synergistales bacterium]